MNILAGTSIRSDYDLLSPLYKLLDEDSDIDLRLLVSGAHLSEAHGLTVQYIERDGFTILKKIKTLVEDDDSNTSRLISTSELLRNAIHAVEKFSPDLIIYAGDREDVIVYAMIATYLGIPSIHFHSGDHASDGYVDNPIRHATSKLATAHFVAHEEHLRRLYKMGESEERGFLVGNIALDRFLDSGTMSLRELSAELKFEIPKEYCIVIFHPINGEDPEQKIRNILESLEKLDITAFVSMPNSDPNNYKIVKVINSFQNKKFFRYYNLDREVFVSLYKNSSFIIGNSSSGIIESASIPVGAINVGLRQKGRLAPENVIFTDGDSVDELCSLINLVMSVEFKEKIATLSNPYGSGQSAKRAYQLIKEKCFSNMLSKTEDPLEF